MRLSQVLWLSAHPPRTVVLGLRFGTGPLRTPVVPIYIPIPRIGMWCAHNVLLTPAPGKAAWPGGPGPTGRGQAQNSPEARPGNQTGPGRRDARSLQSDATPRAGIPSSHLRRTFVTVRGTSTFDVTPTRSDSVGITPTRSDSVGHRADFAGWIFELPKPLADMTLNLISATAPQSANVVK